MPFLGLIFLTNCLLQAQINNLVILTEKEFSQLIQEQQGEIDCYA